MSVSTWRSQRSIRSTRKFAALALAACLMGAMASSASAQAVIQSGDRVQVRKEVVLRIKVKAVDPGLGTWRVHLIHDDLDQDEVLEDMAAFKITACNGT